MALHISSTAGWGLTGWELTKKVTKGRETQVRGWRSGGGGSKSRAVKALCFFNPDAIQPIVNQALKEPVAFAGGMFAGLLRLDLNDDPLKEWVTRTVEASGITQEDVDPEAEEEAPQQIEIE